MLKVMLQDETPSNACCFLDLPLLQKVTVERVEPHFLANKFVFF